MEGLLVDHPRGTLVLETPVHPLDLQRAKPDNEKLLEDYTGEKQTL